MVESLDEFNFPEIVSMRFLIPLRFISIFMKGDSDFDDSDSDFNFKLVTEIVCW